MKKVLVTGGFGFIGSHLVEALLKKNFYVVILDNLSTGKKENLSFLKNYKKNYKIIIDDIRNYNACNRASKDVDFILHQAALRSVPKSLQIPEEYNAVNINGTLNLLKVALKNKVKRFIFASSSSIYGESKKFPQKEDFFPQLISPYALSKLAGEYYCRIFKINYGLEYICLRYFNVYGPKQALDDEYAVVIPKFINCLINNEPPPIFGTGKQSRDFTYISNVVEANLLSLEAKLPKEKDFFAVFNVANGKTHTILELVDLLNQILKKKIKPKFLPPRPGDVFCTFAEIDKAKKVLGYFPKIDFFTGLKYTVDYWLNKRGLK